ncbi:unnamed protein product [Candida verbasci]|uniref:Uncharacterized protein n=1 Tax=Candida verbasci TaxID=1227364 RepID=A0A9W4TUG7_9ASCO|nr:unnamed protein product [Candida verbasci]
MPVKKERGRSLQIELPVANRSKSTNEFTNHHLQQRKKFGRQQSSNLLQTAINQNYKSGLTRSISTHGLPKNHNELSKNIPMVNDDTLQRPQFKRWTSYYKIKDQPSSNCIEGTVSTDTSVSPLTILKDQYDIKRPLKNTPTTPNKSSPISNKGINIHTDNLFKSLESSTNDLGSTPKEISQNKTKVLYDKMVRLASNGVSSLLSNNDSDNEMESYIEANSEEDDTQYQLDSTIEENSYNEIKDEIDKFQTNFINNVQPIQNLNMNRTQRKLIDYRDLLKDEPDNYENEKVICLLGNNYRWKIQNEIISNQFTSIRLRFSSFENKKSRKLDNKIGVIGYIKRYENESKNRTIRDDKITFEQKDSTLKKIWDDAYNECFSKTELDENGEISMSKIAANVKLDNMT